MRIGPPHRTHRDVDAEHAGEQLCPCDASRCGLAELILAAGSVGGQQLACTVRHELLGRRVDDRVGLHSDGRAQRMAAGEHAMVPHDVDAGRRHERAQASEEGLAVDVGMRGAGAGGRLEVDADAAVGERLAGWPPSTSRSDASSSVRRGVAGVDSSSP
jgi:hypothetical protein